MELRPYQSDALASIREHFRRREKRILLHLATGAGKTLVFCEILKSAHYKGTRCLVVVRGKSLVHQASSRLLEHGVPHDIYQGDRTISTGKPINICSIDTLFRRKILLPADLLVIDESHLTQGESYGWLLANYPSAYVLAVTATPHLDRGMRHVADHVVRPITARELIAQGYLAKPRYFSPSTPDLSGVRVRAGEYVESELAAVMIEKAKIRCDLIEEYLKRAAPRSALIFAVNVEHSHLLADMFNGAGIPCAHIDASTDAGERARVIQALEAGHLKAISSVGVMTTGVDIPTLGALILARPTKSYNLYIQMIGRGTRRPPGKDDFIVLDHAGNVREHGLIENERECELDGTGAESRAAPSTNSVATCLSCFATFSSTLSHCPECDKAKPAAKKNEVKHDSTGELEEIEEGDLTTTPWQWKLRELIVVARQKGWKKGAIYHRIKGLYGEKIAGEAWQRIKHLNWPVVEHGHRTSIRSS